MIRQRGFIIKRSIIRTLDVKAIVESDASDGES